MLVPMLDEIIREAAENGTRDVVMGMAHRGRLNVLAHVLGKPYANILVGFETQQSRRRIGVRGGRSGTAAIRAMSNTISASAAPTKRAAFARCPSPSCRTPAIWSSSTRSSEGHARAAQEQREPARRSPIWMSRSALPIAIHGDAAFPGQGVVAETLNMSNLPGYRTGGTIHIIVNNQIGFTTLPSDGRSTLYASDLAKGFEIPIVHVNADDPARLHRGGAHGLAYRESSTKIF